MLVLSRKVGDRIHIGPDVAITIVNYLAVLCELGWKLLRIWHQRDELKEDIEREMNVASQPANQISS